MNGLPSDTVGASKDIWSIKTEQFVPVSLMALSPNYWNNYQSGNLHWFFAIEGCKNPTAARGFYNEFLSNDLNEHRKVLTL